MNQSPRMLWFSVDIGDGIREYELPSDERWFTRQNWLEYKELNEIAVRYKTIVQVNGAPRKVPVC